MKEAQAKKIYLLDYIKKNHKKDFILKRKSLGIVTDLYTKAIDKVLEGKRVKFIRLGELKIFKKKSVYESLISNGKPYKDMKPYFKDPIKALHGYYYFVLFDGKIFDITRYIPKRMTPRYIRDVVIKRNLDLPLLEKNK